MKLVKLKCRRRKSQTQLQLLHSLSARSWNDPNATKPDFKPFNLCIIIAGGSPEFTAPIISSISDGPSSTNFVSAVTYSRTDICSRSERRTGCNSEAKRSEAGLFLLHPFDDGAVLAVGFSSAVTLSIRVLSSDVRC